MLISTNESAFEINIYRHCMYFQTVKNDTVLNNPSINEIIKTNYYIQKKDSNLSLQMSNKQMKFRLHLIRSASAEGYKYTEE